MGERLKKTEEKLKKAGHKAEEKASAGAHKVAEEAKSAGHYVEERASAGARTVADEARSAGQKTKEAAGKAVGHMDVTCDTCGKLMKPGGEYTRVIQGKEYQFCSVPCANRFHPPMAEP